VVDLREEPSAGKPHARICEGEAEWPSYSTATHFPAHTCYLGSGEAGEPSSYLGGEPDVGASVKRAHGRSHLAAIRGDYSVQNIVDRPIYCGEVRKISAPYKRRDERG
jgi:hypothetical protein